MTTLTLVQANELVDLSAPLAEDLANHHWKGLVPGAVRAPAKLTEALSQPAGGRRRRIVLESYEWDSSSRAPTAFELPHQVRTRSLIPLDRSLSRRSRLVGLVIELAPDYGPDGLPGPYRRAVQGRARRRAAGGGRADSRSPQGCCRKFVA
jgi:hypothetical protein